MEMWKNFPLPPWGMALVKKNLCPSLENSGCSFYRDNKTICIPSNVAAGHYFFLFFFYHIQKQGANLFPPFITYLSMQPAFTFIFMFLKRVINDFTIIFIQSKLFCNAGAEPYSANVWDNLKTTKQRGNIQLGRLLQNALRWDELILNIQWKSWQREEDFYF